MQESISKQADIFAKTFEKTQEIYPPYSQTLINFLIKYIEESKETTIQGLLQNLKEFANQLVKEIDKQKIFAGKTNLFLKSTIDIFFGYLIKKYPKETEINLIKQKLTEIGKEFADLLKQAPELICDFSKKIIKNGVNFIMMGHSDLLEYALIKMASKSIRFSVIVPEMRPTNEGYEICNRLAIHNIKTKLITDSALAIYLEQADFVIVGADAVVENGGIINRIGTYSLALIAFAKKKPFYVISESYSFSRIFPLSQNDLPKEIMKNENINLFSDFKLNESVSKVIPLTDYTPPELITLLVTEKGIYTPSAVSDELIQIFGK